MSWHNELTHNVNSSHCRQRAGWWWKSSINLFHRVCSDQMSYYTQQLLFSLPAHGGMVVEFLYKAFSTEHAVAQRSTMHSNSSSHSRQRAGRVDGGNLCRAPMRRVWKETRSGTNPAKPRDLVISGNWLFLFTQKDVGKVQHILTANTAIN